MALEKPYADIPGTTVFDADQVSKAISTCTSGGPAE